MRIASQLVAVTALVAIPAVSAFGSLGHVTVATVATHLVSNTTEAYLKRLLRSNGDDYLSSIATWADSYKYSKGGRFSRGFHFIDAKDDPPAHCSVDYERDCKASGCIVSALGNYTERLLDSSLPPVERIMAARFVVHFVGDMHQPLHVENVARGGNGIHVKWKGRSWNLHHVWDSTIAEEMNGGYHRNPYPQAAKWGAELAAEITEGKFLAVKEDWLAGMRLASPIDTAMIWASQSNAHVCSVVLPEGPKAIEGQELSGDYYDAAAPVLESLVASAGYRLAKWLDLIVDQVLAASEKNMEEDVRSDSWDELEL